jgi:hypothetical protein
MRVRRGGSRNWQTVVAVGSVAVAALAVVLAIVVPAQGVATATIQQRVKTLESKVKSLESSRTNLTRQNRELRTSLACLNRFVPVTIYGNPQNNAGYVYQNSPEEVGLTTALDITEQGGTASFNLPMVNQSCIRSGRFVQLRPKARSVREARAVR